MSTKNNVQNIKDICSFYKNNKDTFNKSIELFSIFMTLTNENYSYNKTYLESYTNELDVFSEKFMDRDELLIDIFKKIGIKLMKTDDVKIVVDNIWTMNSKGIKYKKFDGKFIFKDYINIEFKRTGKIVDVKRFASGNNQLNDMVNFLEEHLKGEMK